MLEVFTVDAVTARISQQTYTIKEAAAHDVESPGELLFDTGVHLARGPAPVRRYLPELIDLTLPLDRAAEGYRAMDERRAIKVLLTV